MHIKSTDRHLFLHYTSSHLDHTKLSIIYSQAPTIGRVCSNKSDFLKHLESMKSWFEVRGYPNKLIEQEIEKVKFFKNSNVVRQQDPKKGVRFVLTHHPLSKLMDKIIKKKTLICCIWITRLKRCLLLNQWFHSAVQEEWAVIWLERNYIQKKELKFPLCVAVSVERLKHLLLPVHLQVKLILLTTNLRQVFGLSFNL